MTEPGGVLLDRVQLERAFTARLDGKPAVSVSRRIAAPNGATGFVRREPSRLRGSLGDDLLHHRGVFGEDARDAFV